MRIRIVGLEEEIAEDLEGGRGSNGAITDDQIEAIFQTARSNGISKGEMEQKVMQKYGVAITALSSDQGEGLMHMLGEN